MVPGVKRQLMEELSAFVSVGRNPGILKVSIMSAIKVAVLRLSSAKDYRGVVTAVMGLPLASTRVVTII